MNDQPREQSEKGFTVGKPEQDPAMTAIDPAYPDGLDAAASAALALAVRSAKRAASEPTKADAVTKGLEPLRPILDRLRSFRPAHFLRRTEPSSPEDALRMRIAAKAKALLRPASPYLVPASAALVALMIGWFGGSGFSAESRTQPDEQWNEAAQSFRRSQEDVVRLTGDVKALKAAFDALKESVDRTRTESVQKQAQLADRLERSERMPKEVASRLARLGEQLERIETAGKEPGPKLAALGDRLDRMERQIVAAIGMTVGKQASAGALADGPAQTGSVDTRPAAKDAPIDGWVLHEVSGGVALIEDRNRRLIEVARGDTLPGIGRVQSIERRGKRWVVVTEKGLIGSAR